MPGLRNHSLEGLSHLGSALQIQPRGGLSAALVYARWFGVSIAWQPQIDDSSEPVAGISLWIVED